MRIEIFILGLLTACPNAICSGFCAVKVIVTDEVGRPAAAQVSLLNSSAKVLQQTTSRNGQAEFCDFGFGDHAIEVSGSPCVSVVIPHVRVIFGKSQLFRVYRTGCFIADVRLTGCPTYFRVTGPLGERLSGVSIASEDAGTPSTTDEYGRALVSSDMGTERTLVFRKDGYEPVRETIDCRVPRYQESVVTLVPTDRRPLPAPRDH